MLEHKFGTPSTPLITGFVPDISILHEFSYLGYRFYYTVLFLGPLAHASYGFLAILATFYYKVLVLKFL